MKSRSRLRHTPAMSPTTEVSVHDRILAERARYVSAGVSTPKLVVSHADGARVTDVDGRSVHRLRRRDRLPEHGPSLRARRRAIREQADEYLHQCFMVGVYEPYVEVCRRLAELSPCAGERAEVDPRQLRRRGGRERRQDRARRDRPSCCRRLRQRVPRPHAPDDDDDRQGEAVQGGLRPVRARGVPGAGAEPVPRRLDRGRDRRAEAALQGRRRPRDGRLRRARAGAGRGRVPPDAAPTTSRACRSSAASTASSTSTTRCSPASAAPARCGRSSTTTGSSPTCSSRASRSAAVCRSPPSRAARRSWTRSPPAASAARSAATRSRARPRSPCSTPSPRRGSSRRRPRSARRCARGSTRWRRARRDRRRARARADARVRAGGAGARSRRRRSSPPRSSAACSCSPAGCTAT